MDQFVAIGLVLIVVTAIVGGTLLMFLQLFDIGHSLAKRISRRRDR